MTDETTQAYLDGDGPAPADEGNLSKYRRLYSALAAEPDEQLADQFAMRVAARVADQSVVNLGNILTVLTVTALGIIALLAIALSLPYVTLELSVFAAPFSWIMQLSLTWVYSAGIVVLLYCIDRWVSASQAEF